MKQKLVIIASALMLALSAPPDAWAQWVKTNVPSSGRCFAALGSYLFVGTSNSGIFRSTDGGSTWDTVNTGLPNIYIGSLLAIGTNLFAGTGSPWSSDVSSGIFLSTDSGKSWQSLSSGLLNSSVNALTLSSTYMFAGTWGGVCRSSDSGRSWISVDSGLAVPHRNDMNINAILVDGEKIFAGGINGVFLSTDSGSIWTTSWLTNGDVQVLAAMGSNIFAGLNNGGIFRSTNDGLTWTPTGWGGQHVQACWVIGTNLFVTTQEAEVDLSTDSGQTWNGVGGDNFAHIDGFALIASNKYMFVGMGDGVYRRPLTEILPPSAVTYQTPINSSITAYPNPFSQSTTISISSPESGAAEVAIVNLLGSEVKRLFSGEMDAGNHDFSWDASGLPPGMYECVVRMSGKAQEIPVVLEK